MLLERTDILKPVAPFADNSSNSVDIGTHDQIGFVILNNHISCVLNRQEACGPEVSRG
jgi:hypothetical protein